MEAVARKQILQNSTEVELAKVRATKMIALCDSTDEKHPTVIMPGEIFLVNLVPMEGLKGLGAHYKGESFFVEAHEWTFLDN